jgi:hypothetical protein
MTFRLRARLAGLERTFPRRCPACAGRPRIDGMLFRYKGILLLPCPACGGRGNNANKMSEGVNPALLLGAKVAEGVDPACI